MIGWSAGGAAHRWREILLLFLPRKIPAGKRQRNALEFFVGVGLIAFSFGCFVCSAEDDLGPISRMHETTGLATAPQSTFTATKNRLEARTRVARRVCRHQKLFEPKTMWPSSYRMTSSLWC